MDRTVVVLNTSVLTSYGTYSYEPISTEAACALVAAASNVVSAVGHEATASLLSEILGREIPAQRITVEQAPGQSALVFKLRDRLPWNADLGLEELRALPYQLGLLRRER